MDYRIEVLDPSGRRLRWFDEVYLLHMHVAGPDSADRIRGLLPKSLDVLAPGYGIRVWIDGALFAEGRVVAVEPLWGDARKLVVDEYVRFHEVVSFEALGMAARGDAPVAHAYTNKDVSAIARHLINSAHSRLHYGVPHSAFPDGAAREYLKFSARRDDGNVLEVGGIGAGTWAGPTRIDASGAYAKDGHTIAGLVVDGVAWPDVRLMMVRAEELALNAAAVARHPETAGWTAEEYDASLHKRLAEQAQASLQARIDAWGIDYIELNPHRDVAGVLDGRIDSEGRYVGLVYGSSHSLNAAIVELGPAEAWLNPQGTDLVPEWETKDFLSYAAVQTDTVETAGVVLASYQAQGSVLQALTALCYAAGGFVFRVDANQTVSFRARSAPDRTLEFDARKHALVLGSDDARLVNRLRLRGNPLSGTVESEHLRQESIDAFGESAASLAYFPIAHGTDAARLAEGLLDDLAYPRPSGRIEFFDGEPTLRVGEVIGLRGDLPRRIDAALPGEWGGAFANTLIGAVSKIEHRISGHRATTIAHFGSPLRSVEDPLAFMVRGQESESEFFAFRLDDAAVGLETGFHLD